MAEPLPQSPVVMEGANLSTNNLLITIPGLIASSSSVSTSTVDTEMTSPMIPDEQHVTLVGSMESASPTSLAHQEGSNSSSDELASSTCAFTLGGGSQKGAKRTASGAVKLVDAQKRLESIGREQRASELSEKLKTRLQYAMLKIERGWEGQSLDQIETMSTPTASNPNSPIVSNKHGRRRSVSPDGYITSPMTSSTKRLSQSAFRNGIDPSNNFHDENFHVLAQGSRLAPAPKISSPSGTSAAIRKQQHRRSLNEHFQRRPPALKGSSYSANAGDGAPRTPTDGRFPSFAGQSSSQPGMSGPTNQAEKDAIDTLLFLSSPNNSGSMAKKPASQSRVPPSLQRQGSGKRVNFLIE